MHTDLSDKKSTFHAILQSLGFAVSVVWNCNHVLSICIGLATIVEGLGPMVVIWLSKFVLDSIVNVVKSGGESSEVMSVFRILGIQCLVLLGIMILNRVTEYLRYYMGEQLKLSMTTTVLRKISGLDLLFFEDSRFYDMIARAMEESSAKPLTLINKICGIFRWGITFVSLGWLIARLSVPMFIAVILLCLPHLIAQIKFSKKSFTIQYKRAHDARMAGRLAGIMTDRRYVPEVISFGLWSFLLEKWILISKRFVNQDIQLSKQRGLMGACVAFLLILGNAIVTGYIVYLGMHQNPIMTTGTIMMYVGAFSGGGMALGRVLDNISELYEGSLFLQNYIEFNKLKPNTNLQVTKRPVPDQIESIELINISFKYPSREEYALKNINFKFRRSESVLVVGPNGAGKTTLIKLLAQLYDPTEGQILLNGINIKEYDLEALRKKIGVVFQEFIRYALSAEENIGCGYIDELENKKKIVNAAIMGKADSFIKKLPLQYDTILSKEFKDGQELSLGQWQRICIARMFMKNSPVFILDEPTACLDIETEAHLLQEITTQSNSKICILVSHRMFRQGIANQIVVLDNGRIAETGTYESLLTKNGKFSMLCELYHNMSKDPVATDLS